MGGVCSCSKVIIRSTSVVPEERVAVQQQTASGDGRKLSTHKAHRRGSVSAEAAAVGSLKQKISLVPKSDEARSQLRKLIKSTLLFHELEDDQENGVLDALFERHVKAGETIIQEGDVGDNFYLIESGVFEASKEGDVKFTYDNKGAFGELALMYNCPRAATITAVTDGTLWGMDRFTFRAVVVSSMAERRDRYESTLQQMEIFRHLSHEQLAAIADCVTVEQYEAGQHIIRESEELATNTKFYMIESGTVECLRTFEGKKWPTKTLGPGEVFGEVALLTKAPRQADCVAATKVKCLAMSRDAFERVMGPVEEVLAQHIAEYSKLNAGVECGVAADAGTQPRSSSPDSAAADSTKSEGVLTGGPGLGSEGGSAPHTSGMSSQMEEPGKANGRHGQPLSSRVADTRAAGSASASSSRPGSKLFRASPSGAPPSRCPHSQAAAGRVSPFPAPSRIPSQSCVRQEALRDVGGDKKLAPVRSFPLLDVQEGSRQQTASEEDGGRQSPSKLASQIQEWERRLSGREASGTSAAGVPGLGQGGTSGSRESPAWEAVSRMCAEVDEAKRIAGLDVTERVCGASEASTPCHASARPPTAMPCCAERDTLQEPWVGSEPRLFPGPLHPGPLVSAPPPAACSPTCHLLPSISGRAARGLCADLTAASGGGHGEGKVPGGSLGSIEEGAQEGQSRRHTPQ